MKKLDSDPDSLERQQAEDLLVLGILSQGISHRLANHLNTISLNSELSIEVMRSSSDRELLAETLSTIARVAHIGGSLVHALNDFSRSETGHGEIGSTTIGALVTNAEELLNLKSRSLNLVYLHADVDKALQVQVNSFAVSAMLACLIHTAMISGENSLKISVDHQQTSLDVQLRADQCCWEALQGVGPQVLSFSRRVLAEQGGSLQIDNTALLMRFLRTESLVSS